MFHADNHWSYSRIPIGVFLLILIVTVGCGSGDPTGDAIRSANSNNVIRVAGCYRMYQFNHDFKGPPDKRTLIEFLEQPEVLAGLRDKGIDPEDLNALFISQRDRQEMQIRWGVAGAPMPRHEPVVFESVGVDGRRRVGFLSGRFEEIEDDMTYQKMLNGEYEPPPVMPSRQ